MRVTLASVIDEYAEGGECAVMLEDGRVLALSVLATTVLAAVRERQRTDPAGISVDELAAILVRTFGAPLDDDSGHKTTRTVVGSLAESGVLKVLS